LSDLIPGIEMPILSVHHVADMPLPSGPVLSGGQESWGQGGMQHIGPHFSGNHWVAYADGREFQDINNEVKKR
jgi:hypothetical protein